MISTLWARLRPALYTRGRLAAALCVVYLLLVLAAGVYTIYDAVFVESIGASFAGLPLVVLTAPLSFVAVPAITMVQAMLFPNGGGIGSTVVAVLTAFLLAAVQAYLGYLVLRGPRISAVEPVAPPPT